MSMKVLKNINSILSLLLARINQFIIHQENSNGLELCKVSEAERVLTTLKHPQKP